MPSSPLGIAGDFGPISADAVNRLLGGHPLLGGRRGFVVLDGYDVETAEARLHIRADASLYKTTRRQTPGAIGEWAMLGQGVLAAIFPQATGLHVTRGRSKYAILGPTRDDEVQGQSLLTLDWVQDALPFAWSATNPPSLLSLDWAKGGQPFSSNDTGDEVLSRVTLWVRADAHLTSTNGSRVQSSVNLWVVADAWLGIQPPLESSCTLTIQAACSLAAHQTTSTSSADLYIQAEIGPVEAEYTALGASTLFVRATDCRLTTHTVRKVRPCELPPGVLRLTSNLPFGAWQTSPDAVFTWEMLFTCGRTLGQGRAAVGGFLVLLDRSPDTSPWWDAARTSLTNKEYDLSQVPPYGADSWWFHVAAYNPQGIGAPAHYNVKYNHQPGRPGAGFMRINGVDTLGQTPLVAYRPASSHVFTWDVATDPDSDSVQYHIQIATLPQFGLNPSTRLSEIVLEDETVPASSFILTQTLDPTVYFWRIRAFDGHEYGEWGPVGSFRVNSPPTAPDELRVYKTG